MKLRTNIAVMASSIAAILASAGAASAALELVIKNTDAVPGIADVAWAATNMFQAPSIDQNGNVGFRGTLLAGTGGVTTSNNGVMYHGMPAGLNLFARTGFQAPGLPGGDNVLGFNSQNVPQSPNGNIWFGATTTNPNGYVATGPYNALTKVARRGDVLPGVALAIADNPASSSNYSNVNNAGQTAIGAGLTGFASSGVWVGNGANLQLAYETGQTYAGLPAVTTIRSPQTGYMINGAGSLYGGILMTNNAGAGVTSDNNEYLTTLAFGGSTFNVLAHEGTSAPGAGGATYQRGLFNSLFNSDDSAFFFGNGNYNNAGHAIYSTGLEGAGVVAANNAALFYHDGTSANLLRRRGDATTAVAGATFAINAQQAFNARLNNNDQVAMTASLTQGVGGVTASNDATLMRTTLGSANDMLIAREGSAVPITSGALWGTSFGNLMQNNAGQIVFSTTLLDDAANPNDNVTTANDLALFAWDPIEGLSLIAREGDDLSSIGINMTLTGNWLQMFNAANAEGGANAFSDSGWLTFRVSGTALPGFTDNMAIVRTFIPTPGSGMLAIIGGAALVRRRRTR